MSIDDSKKIQIALKVIPICSEKLIQTFCRDFEHIIQFLFVELQQNNKIDSVIMF